MTKFNYEITDLEALAKHEGGKFVATESVTLTTHKPRRDLIRAALVLGQVPPGITLKSTEEPIAEDTKSPFKQMIDTARDEEAA